MKIEDHYSKHLPNTKGDSQFKFLVTGNEYQNDITYLQLPNSTNNTVWCKTAEWSKINNAGIGISAITSVSYAPGLCSPTDEIDHSCTGVDGYEVTISFNK